MNDSGLALALFALQLGTFFLFGVGVGRRRCVQCKRSVKEDG